jgi:hypothetical protein
MQTGTRTISEVLTHIVGNFEDIVRSEIKLAKAQTREELARATRRAAWIGIGIVAAFFAAAFALTACFFALAYIVPDWAAALIIAGVLALVSGVAFRVQWLRRRALSVMSQSPLASA